MSHTPGPWRVVKNINNDEKDRTKITEILWSIAAGKREGPFENKGHFHPDEALYFDDEINIVAVSLDRDYGYYEGGIQSEANARLIAAAPELLQAAKSFVEWAEDCWGSWAINDSETPKAKSEYDAAKAAIAKAEGRK